MGLTPKRIQPVDASEIQPQSGRRRLLSPQIACAPDGHIQTRAWNTIATAAGPEEGAPPQFGTTFKERKHPVRYRQLIGVSQRTKLGRHVYRVAGPDLIQLGPSQPQPPHQQCASIYAHSRRQHPIRLGAFLKSVRNVPLYLGPHRYRTSHCLELRGRTAEQPKYAVSLYVNIACGKPVHDDRHRPDEIGIGISRHLRPVIRVEIGRAFQVGKNRGNARHLVPKPAVGRPDFRDFVHAPDLYSQLALRVQLGRHIRNDFIQQQGYPLISYFEPVNSKHRWD